MATGTALATIGNLGGTDDGASSVLYFGGDPNLPLPYYKGLIDEVGVYSAALSASDIATIYSLRGVAQAASAATITGNLIGTNAAGTMALPNGNDGIDLVDSSFNVIGGTTTGDLNVVSGNAVDGVELNGVETTANVVEGDYIGTDITGTVGIANVSDGVEIDSGASDNTIGGTSTGARNVISGNTSFGIEIDTGATGNLVDGDYVGVDATGDAALGNITGILIASTANTVGGTVAGSGNVIAGNDGSPSFYNGVQVLIGGFSALDSPDDNLVAGNLIGLDAAGATLAGATGSGVFVNSGVGNTIGGTVAAARNVISGNSDGVLVEGGSANTFEGNYVGTDSSGSVGIGNGAAGSDIAIDGSAGNTVGGTIAAARNVISGATAGNGVNIFNTGATGNVVVGNDIGTDASGTIALPNQVGINLAITSGNNTIGGATSLAGTGAGNLIYGSSFAGINVYEETTTDTIVGNAIVVNTTGLYLQADTSVQIGGTNAT